MVTNPGRFEEDKLQVESKTSAEKNIVTKYRDVELEWEEGFVNHRNHVIVESEYPVINIQGCQLLLVDAHHVLGLGGHQPLLHLPPGHRVQAAVWDLQSRIVETFYIPKLEDMIDNNNEPCQPEEDTNEYKQLGDEPHITEVDRDNELTNCNLVSIVVLRKCVFKKKGIVDAFCHENCEEHYKYELQELQCLLEHHHGEPVLLMVIVDLAKEGIEIINMAPLGLPLLRHHVDHNFLVTIGKLTTTSTNLTSLKLRGAVIFAIRPPWVIPIWLIRTLEHIQV